MPTFNVHGPRFTRGETIFIDTGDTTTRIGHGGESAVHRVRNPATGKADLAAKLWKQPDLYRSDKTEYLTNNPPDFSPPNTGALPIALLRLGQETAGYLMSMLDSSWQPIMVCYNQAAAASAGAGANYGCEESETGYRRRLRIVANLAQTIGEAHDRGYIIGDLNETNVLVNRDGAVALLDSDSWQTPSQDGHRRWNCTVGRAEYTPPELLQQLGQPCHRPGCRDEPPHQTGHTCLRRTTNHDAFAMAALIFRILMLGEDPFGQSQAQTGQPEHLTVEQSTTARRITAGLFRYGSRHSKCCGPRDEACRKRWQQLPQEVRQMLDQALGAP